MCLYDKKRFRLTLKPIKVYKIVRVLNDEFFSPYHGTKLNKYMVGYPGQPITIIDDGPIIYQFGKGFIHAYTSLEEALEDLELLSRTRPYINYKIITGYIPRLIRYAKESEEEFVSTQICARIIVFPDLNKKE